jgi:hypothetical protein
MEVENMNSLITALSLESDDTSRRQHLATLFEEELAKPDPTRFTDLFDKVLVTTGDRVQGEARKNALENPKLAESDDDDQEAKESDGDLMMGKSAEEKQLWALVDMMVQSKTLVKRAFGDLGSKGTFR